MLPEGYENMSEPEQFASLIKPLLDGTFASHSKPSPCYKKVIKKLSKIRQTSFLYFIKIAFLKGLISEEFVFSVIWYLDVPPLHGQYNEFGFYRFDAAEHISRLDPVDHKKYPQMLKFLNETKLVDGVRYSFGDYEFSFKHDFILDFTTPRGVPNDLDPYSRSSSTVFYSSGHEFKTEMGKKGYNIFCDYIQYVKDGQILKTPIVLPVEDRYKDNESSKYVQKLQAAAQKLPNCTIIGPQFQETRSGNSVRSNYVGAKIHITNIDDYLKSLHSQ